MELIGLRIRLPVHDIHLEMQKDSRCIGGAARFALNPMYLL